MGWHFCQTLVNILYIGGMTYLSPQLQTAHRLYAFQEDHSETSLSFVGYTAEAEQIRSGDIRHPSPGSCRPTNNSGFPQSKALQLDFTQYKERT